MREKVALLPEELEKMKLSCVVCRGEIPATRARRRKDTCSPECYSKFRAWRKHILFSKRCHACLAPYTEKQREEFRAWRRDTGQIRATAGRPPIDREKRKMAELLQRILEPLNKINEAGSWMSYEDRVAFQESLPAFVAEAQAVLGAKEPPKGELPTENVATPI